MVGTSANENAKDVMDAQNSMQVTATEQFSMYIKSMEHDPLRFVLMAFPWGEPGPLKDEKGPRPWQVNELAYIGERLQDGEMTVHEAIQTSVASGHGIGKSALVSWLILWAISTKVDTRGVITANTEAQLKTKTWSEVAKWYNMCITKDWFEYTATAIFSKIKSRERTWRIDMIPWSITNTEAFAGLHNKGNRILLIFDEASAIDDKIFEVASGALTDTDTEIIWALYGNPTRNTGYFRKTHGQYSHRWRTSQIDSRTVEGTNLPLFKKWADDFGEDSDYFKVRVRGQFPSAGDMQFIGSDLVTKAMSRPTQHGDAALVMGVDVARYGDDRSVIFFRRGRDARTQKPKVYRNLSTMVLADMVVECINNYNPTMVFVDGGGIGGAVVDRLHQLGYTQLVHDIQFGSTPKEPERFKNKRAEMWSNMRDWLDKGSLPDDSDLEQDLIGPEYEFDLNGKLIIESKKNMKNRGLASSDIGDALALTFAEPVPIMGDGVRSRKIRVKRSR